MFQASTSMKKLNDIIKELFVIGKVDASVITKESKNKDEEGMEKEDNEDEVMNKEEEDDDLLAVLESWIGLPEASFDWETDTMEEMAPFQPEFYQNLGRLLILIWKPEEALSMLHSNVLLDDTDCPPEEMSLYTAMMPIRVTRLLRYWMELNVRGHETTATDENAANEILLSRHLLHNNNNDKNKNNNDTDNKNEFPGRQLVEALFHHIEQLPIIQSQINHYTQSLMRGDVKIARAGEKKNNSGKENTDRQQQKSGQGLADAQSRLLQYQQTQETARRLNQEWEEHITALEHITGEWYSVGSTDVRRLSRSCFGSVWSQFVSRSGSGGGGVKMENTTSSGIKMTLRVLHRILQGTLNRPLEKSHQHLLTYHLIPLHRPSSMVLWRDQTSLLELYHEPLVQCIAILLQKKPDWISLVIKSLLEPEVWNKGGNTPKLVLLLHEIDTYLGLLPDNIDDDCPSFMQAYPILLKSLGTCMASDHSRLAERALTFVKNKNFKMLMEQNYDTTLSILLPYLVRNEPSWNPTVRKMTYNVLKRFQDIDEEKFLQICNKRYPIGPAPANTAAAAAAAAVPGGGGTARQNAANETDTSSGMPKDFSLKSAMGGWKPPTTGVASTRPGGMVRPGGNKLPRGSGGGVGSSFGGVGGSAGAGAAPPLTVTGVAPWSIKGTSTPNRSSMGKKNAPPLGVTGVAPWAMNKRGPTPPTKRRVGQALSSLGESKQDGLDSSSSVGTQQQQQNDVPRVIAYMEKIKPAEQETGTSSWSLAQMAETPTLLPTLKFHDLVFGHDLGKGAFGSVRYARLIDRSRTRSHWAEYAVKVISTDKIKEMGYEASVQRELAVLRILSHPGIARLVSSFRFREGVYLVLEYASGGDLHSLLQKHGSLDHDSTRFVIGEVVAALSSIHDLGLVYVDLKPENIVITEPGHIKLTDFGGCRPVTQDAKSMIGASAKNLLKELRDGDWKPQKKRKEDSKFDMDDSEEEKEGDKDKEEESIDYDPNADTRIEGTTAYLPPEVVLGAFPSPAADSWALGCVLYQCLSGRPPIVESDESATKTRIVSFDATESQPSDENGTSSLFGGSHASKISPTARDLITKLMNRYAMNRPSMSKVAEHSFFTDSDTNVYALYQTPAHPLDIGDVAPVADADWSRRQFSSIWAPQPQAYKLDVLANSSSSSSFYGSGGISSSGPIPEGDEATSFFFKMSTTSSSRPTLPLPNSTPSAATTSVIQENS